MIGGFIETTQFGWLSSSFNCALIIKWLNHMEYWYCHNHRHHHLRSHHHPDHSCYIIITLITLIIIIITLIIITITLIIITITIIITISIITIVRWKKWLGGNGGVMWWKWAACSAAIFQTNNAHNLCLIKTMLIFFIKTMLLIYFWSKQLILDQNNAFILFLIKTMFSIYFWSTQCSNCWSKRCSQLI